MLLDTSGLLTLIHVREPRHADAITFFQAAHQKVTTSYVLDEFVALAHVRGVPRAGALSFVEDLQDGMEVEVVYVNETLHRAGLRLLQNRLDKDWSLCDAVSMVLMQQRNLRDTLSTDHHFAQSGFVPLLRA